MCGIKMKLPVAHFTMLVYTNKRELEKTNKHV